MLVHFILGLSVFTLVTGDCSIPTLPKDGFFMTCGTLTGSICQIFCRYTNKVLIKKCAANGTWVGDTFDCTDDDDDDCEKSLKAPANGSIVGACNKNYGSVCVFKCNTGFDLVGSAQVYCLGQWTTSEPTCVKAGATNSTVKCSALNPPANGHLDGRCYQGSPVGSVCNFVCSSGYTLVGSSSSICLANGQWSAWAPSCNKPSTTKAPDNNSQNPFTFPAQTTSKPTWPSQPSQQTTVSPGKCSSVKDVENGRLKGDCQPGIKTRTCSVVCRFGYYADGGSKSITCQENGQWSGKLSSCKRAQYLLVQTWYW